MSSSKNKIFQTTSFLSGMNSAYINELLSNFFSTSLYHSKNFFLVWPENKDLIKKETAGASWRPQKIKNNQNGDLDYYEKLLPDVNVLEIEKKITKEYPPFL